MYEKHDGVYLYAKERIYTYCVVVVVGVRVYTYTNI